MSNGSNPNRSIGIDHLVDDAVGTNPKGAQALQPAPEQMTRVRFALQQQEGFRYSVDQWPLKGQQLAAGAPDEHNSRHGLTGSEFVELLAKLIESDDIAFRQLG